MTIPSGAKEIIISSVYIKNGGSIYGSYVYIPMVTVGNDKYVYGTGGKASNINESCIIRWRINKNYAHLVVSESEEGSKTNETYSTLYYR